MPHVYCIGDANGKLMLAHAASAQGISAIENMQGRSHVLNHLSVPAACFTHPEVSRPNTLHLLLLTLPPVTNRFRSHTRLSLID